MQCCRKKQGIEARIADHALVVSFPDERQPRVWRKDLTGVTSSVTEIQEGAGKFTLAITDSATGLAETIGVFTDKTAAQAAMQAVAGALLQGNSAATSGKTCPARRLLGRIFRLALWLVALAVVILIMLSTFMPQNDKLVKNSIAPVSPAPMKTGVPVPADQLFGR